ncbi:NAD-glutamate dehydrogenase [Geoalkalibacter halelectricus]|uniref:NAD-glutamate dehydrogenase n=1 Tax=Geoalkalibacter halelectricus TaxID=2847045 RepID=A0ABY5ZHD4_9BACT|nr:NAD-glutamate dehydrogenase [Geoalkalibacter halelectricus]MDO3379647.1 NAD-glutamate dehydrogenase [Geoalkalibacter halelectricus]UWZ78537.1 NAD-glutamate dehydrogenase [Geoalkalibacter halelectricus]
MKIFSEFASQDLDRRNATAEIQAIFDRLSASAPPEKATLYANLARELEAHTPHSYFLHLPAERVAGWIAGIFDFLDARRQDVALRLVRGGRGGRWFLLTNTPDAPFLVDSLQALLNREHIRFQVIAHPILHIRRQKGQIVELGRRLNVRNTHESLIIVELQGLQDGRKRRFEEALNEAFKAVLEVRTDQKKIAARLRHLEKLPSEANNRDFWNWLQNDNFLAFGYRCWEIAQPGGAPQATLVGEPLGIFPGVPSMQPGETQPLARFGSDLHRRILRADQAVAEETETLSPVYRNERLRYLGWREMLQNGNWREHAFCGLFSQKFAEEPTFSIPPLRRKIEAALHELGIPRGCHDYNKTIEIFNTFPKVELFFLGAEEVRNAVRSFSFLYRQGGVKVVVAPSLSVRGATLLLILPRAFYDPDHFDRLEAYIRRFFSAEEATARIIHFSAEYLSLHVSVAPVTPDSRPDLRRLEQGLTEIARPWEMKLRVLLERRFGEDRAAEFYERYVEGFTPEYRALSHPRFALRDIQGVEAVRREGGEFFSLWGPFHNAEEFFRLQFYSRSETYLNELIPLLENLHLSVIEELDFILKPGEDTFYIKSFAVKNSTPDALPLAEVRDRLLEVLTALRLGRVENDNLNRLVVLTGLSWKEIDVFRGYRNYYQQLGAPFTKRRVAYALIHNPRVARLLFDYFDARFQPREEWQDQAVREEQALSPLRMELASALEDVADMNEDRILRTLFNLIDSTVRTNFYQRQSDSDYFFAFKISAIGIIEMPAPRPLFEIYVHGADMEGIHLRGGRVARGGIRWSDRPDDFRTEVLGLMKTQMTKNAVIVPVGSKGGFIVQTPFTSREQGAELARDAYVTFMRGLLDLTDNRKQGQVVRHPQVVAYDEEDPYLVVAADKGTAHLPDTANAVARDYGFWLDDAFASGGSKGYDHKALGITARGAWECVKRHFRELGKDIQSEPFTVVGIGDMSGDVFGNGMLLSRQIRLVAAFDHRHIFLDPDPDPETSFRERDRLFRLPRSSWDDYDRALISEGGGVVSRQAKDIPLSPQVRKLLGVRHGSMDGQGLVRAILQAEVDLLWNGGIGTYVKAAGEKHEEVGDRGNDGVRIDATQVRARVVGEGGNLGLTQRARIEIAMGGGAINTDSIDNSAGVDCSDHEVNLKIFMQYLAERQVLTDIEERDRLLRGVSDEVCAAVLHNNYTQSLAVSLDLRRCREDNAPFVDLIERLVNAGLLDRAGEFLPTGKELLARTDKSLTRPELAVLLAYSKMQIFQVLLDKGLPQGEKSLEFLAGYFPRPIRERFDEHLAGHPLAREITATVITNTLVDGVGCAFIQRLGRRSGRSLAQCLSTLAFFDLVFDGAALRREVFALDNRIAAEQQYLILLQYSDLLQDACLWALQQDLSTALNQGAIEEWQGRAEEFLSMLAGVVPAAEWQDCRQRIDELEQVGLPRAFARRVASFHYLGDLLPLVPLSEECGQDLHTIVCTHRDLGQHLDIAAMREAASKVPLRDRWDRMAHETFIQDLQAVHYDLTGAVLREADGNVEKYLSARRKKLNNLLSLLKQVQARDPVNFHPFTVLGRALNGLLDAVKRSS